MRQTIRSSILFFLLSYSFVELYAQSENLIFRNITPDDGLPITTVTNVAQDAYGYIWIGSWNGTYRYDGRSFEKKSNDGRYLTPDQRGGVWIAHDRTTKQIGRVAYYHPRTDSLTFFEVQSWEGFHPQITVDESNKAWVGSEKGLNYFNPNKRAFEKDSIARADFGHILLISHKNGSISFFYQESPVKWGIGNRSENGTIHYEDFPIDQNNPNPSLPFNASSIPNMEGYLDNGILIINKLGWAFKETFSSEWTFVKPDRPAILSNMGDIITHNNELYVQHVNGLTKFNILTGKSVTYNHNPLNPKSILPAEQLNVGIQLFIDRQDVLWAPSFSHGISRLNLYESDFGLLRSEDGTPFRDVISALEMEDGSFWIGLRIEDEGLLRFDADGNILQKLSGPFDTPPGKSESDELSHPFVWSLLRGSDGSIWAGTGSPNPDDGGLNRIRAGSDKITRFKHDPEDDSSLYPGNWVVNLIEDGSGRIWFKDFNQIAWIDPEKEVITRYQHPEEMDIGENEPIYLLRAAGGDLIVSTQKKSFYRIHHEDLSTDQIDLTFEWDIPTTIYDQDINGQFWAGNTDGFGRLDSTLTKIEKWYALDSLNISVTALTSSQIDVQNNRWMGSDNGLIKFNPITEMTTHYSYERGLQGYSFRGTSYKGPSGKLYFAGNGGINIFDPAQIQANPHPPKMVFTKMSLNGEDIQLEANQSLATLSNSDEAVSIQPNVSSIRFEFAALHFAGENSNQVQYKLEGFDEKWRDGGRVGQATYTNLEPGKYTFRIKGSNLDGVWSDGSDSLAINILPPWWRTWWAYGFYALLLISGIVVANKVQRKRIQQKEREKTRDEQLAQAEEIEKAYKNLEVAHENLKSAQDQLVQQEKLASLGQLTAGIAHEIKNPLNFVNNFSEVSVELVDEALEEIEKLENSEVREEIIEILYDVKGNLSKVHSHGARADSIVKSMLQHSRGGSGKMEPTDLNVLIKEYVNLSFHGMRAGKDPVHVDIQLDLDEKIGQVNLIAEDFSRVILNLCSNAFDAMREKANAASEYLPKLFIKTERITKDELRITITDNGPGITDDLKDKILQPFFTTKKGTEGTGLGLSITNDIVKAHGGSLDIQSQPGETVFQIQLPL